MSTLAEDVATTISGHPRIPSKANGGPVTVMGHGGLFTALEVKRISRQLPAIIVSATSTLDPAANNRQFGNQIWTPFAFSIDILASGPHVTQGSKKSRHEKVQVILLGVLKLLGMWTAVVNATATETAPVYHLGNLGKPKGVTAANVYNSDNDKNGLAWWRVKYTADYEHPATSASDFKDWDTLRSDYPKDDWREDVVVDPSDPDPEIRTEKDMSP